MSEDWHHFWGAARSVGSADPPVDRRDATITSRHRCVSCLALLEYDEIVPANGVPIRLRVT